MDSSKNSGSQLITYLIAIAPALFQLIAVVSGGLADVLRLDQYVFNPNFINLANFFTILLSIAVIGTHLYWDHNKFSLSEDGNYLFATPKKIWKIVFRLTVFVFIFSSIFIFIVLNKPIFVDNIGIWSSLQWFSYIMSMTFISYITFIVLSLINQQRSARNMQENYIPKLLDSLRRNGHVKNPDIIIESVNKEIHPNEAIVRFTDSKRYKVSMDFTGEMMSIEKYEN